MASACKAVAILRGEGAANAGVHGVMSVIQPAAGQPTTRISGRVAGLVPGSRHGLRVLAYGDESDGSRSMGGTFNPFLLDHAGRGDPQRPVGCLGNIEAGADGVAAFDFIDRLVTLVGPLSVVGRGVAVTAGEDDGGKGTHPDSATDGHAGPVLACGVLGLCAIPPPT
jgi:Cu-Zn family superoxide dismutase